MFLAIRRINLGSLETSSNPIGAVCNVCVVIVQIPVGDNVVEYERGHLRPHLDGVLEVTARHETESVHKRTGLTLFPMSLRRQAIPPATIPAATLVRRTNKDRLLDVVGPASNTRP